MLAGLVDSLEDRIIACENVLTINPANEKVPSYLADLHCWQQASLSQKNLEEARDLLNQATACAGRIRQKKERIIIDPLVCSL